MKFDSKTVTAPGYDRGQVSYGIVHIGVGNFHRAHMEYYTDSLIRSDSTQSGWGICGAMLRAEDEYVYRALKSQDGLYTLTVCGRDGIDRAQVIGSLVDLLWAKENPDDIIERIASPEVSIVSMTITEGGYNIDKKSGEFMVDVPEIARDIAREGKPVTVFGFLAEGLRRRRENGAGRLTILSCDNLQHNGDTARNAFISFFRCQYPDLASWVEQNVTFPNSMVDRITPATRGDDLKRLDSRNGSDDKVPVFCEDFIQWVIEDRFAAGRPAWERVGVEFTDDVTAYENMKLSLLNASHTLLSYPSFLTGYRKVDEAMSDADIAALVNDFMNIDVTPYVPAPPATDLDLYKKTLIERFRNHSVSDQIARLCFDGISKFPVYIVPNLRKMIADGHDTIRLSFLIAAYRHYLKYNTDDNGETFEISEPAMSGEDRLLIASEDPHVFLSLSAFGGVFDTLPERFVNDYDTMVDLILHNGVRTALKKVTEKR